MLAAPEYAATVERLGEIDVLCSHAPPAVPELAYDVVSRRFESPSPALRPASAATAPARPCSGTSTSRWRRAAGWVAPNA